MGSREQQIEKERQEMLSAKLKYDECTKSIEGMERKVSEIVRQLAGFEGLEELARLKSDVKELEEAIHAGEDVENKLRNVMSALESAGNWGTWDMLGGGLLATAQTFKDRRSKASCP